MTHIVNLALATFCFGAAFGAMVAVVLERLSAARPRRSEVMAKRKGQVAGHGFWAVTPEGHSVHIKGDPNMPQETLDALLGMMDLAHKNATEVMSCGHTKDNLCSGDGERWFCGQCVLDEVEGKE